MKAVVLEVKDGKAIVLTEEGLTKKVKYEGQCGDEIELASVKTSVTPMKKKRVAGAIAAAVAVTVIAGGVYSQSLTQTDTYVAMNEEEEVTQETSEEASDSGVDTGSCLESDEDSEKKTDNAVTEEKKEEEKTAKEENEEKEEEPEKTEKTQTKKQSVQQTIINTPAGDAAPLYQMQQHSIGSSSGQQESSSTPTVSQAATGTSKRNQSSVSVASQALASEKTPAEDSTEAPIAAAPSVPAQPSVAAEPAGNTTVAPEVTTTNGQEVIQVTESAQNSANETAAQPTTTQVDQGAENAGTVPEE